MTNGERIRKMTDEELAEMFEKHIKYCEDCPAYYNVCDVGLPEGTCKDLCLRWLQREAEE